MQEDILDIFSELEGADPDWVLDHVFPDEPDEANMHIVHGPRENKVSSKISTLSEVFLEWYLFDAEKIDDDKEKNITSFLQDNELQDIFDETDFS